MIPDEKLDFWIKTQKNVLLIGKKGCAKTSQTIQALERNNIKYKYFSASTLDPWVDFVGIPKEKIVGEKREIEFIKPGWHNEEIECIVADEFNRANSKIKNACLELIQFKSINGVKFPNLKMVWAMINEADDEDYDVEKMDPAQKDRFHIHYTVPYLPDRVYFEKKFKDNGSKCIVWWKDLPGIVKNEVSPRRLDYAMEYFEQGGDLYDILPANSNIEKLTRMLAMRNIEETLDSLRLADVKEIKEWFSHAINIDLSLGTIVDNEKYLNDFLYYLPQEEISKLISTNDKIQKRVLDKYDEEDTATQILDDIIKTDANKSLCKSLTQQISAIRLRKAPLVFSTKDKVKFNDFTNANRDKWTETVKQVSKPPGYYAKNIKIEHINSLCRLVPDDTDAMKQTLGIINKIALSSSDTIFSENTRWVSLLNSYLLKQQDEYSIGSQKLIKKEFGCLFTKIVRLKLEPEILETKIKLSVTTQSLKSLSWTIGTNECYSEHEYIDTSGSLYKKKDFIYPKIFDDKEIPF